MKDSSLPYSYLSTKENVYTIDTIKSIKEIAMSENITPSEKREQLKEEYKNDPMASAILNSKWMSNLISEIEKPEESTSGQVE